MHSWTQLQHSMPTRQESGRQNIITRAAFKFVEGQTVLHFADRVCEHRTVHTHREPRRTL